MNDAMAVFLDTEVLRRDPQRRKAPFAALEYLVSTGYIQLHVSDLSIREFVSAQVAEAQSVSRDLETALKRARTFAGETWAPDVDVVVDRAAGLRANAAQIAQKSISDWCSAHDVVVHPIRGEHAQRVVDAYFAGSAPFRSAKERKDFPDAFIFEAVADLTTDSGTVVFVSGDERFRDACRAALPNVRVFSDLESLLQLDELADALRERVSDVQFQKLFKYLAVAVGEHARLPEQIASVLIGRRLLVQYPIEDVAVIQRVPSVPTVFLEEALSYYGSGIVTMPFSARTGVDLSLLTSAEAISDPHVGRFGEIRHLENDTAELIMSRTVVVAGTLLIGIDATVLESEATDQQVQTALAAAEFVIDSLSVFGDGSDGVKADVLLQHAKDQAERELAAGNLDTTIDAGEEADRKARAQWFNVPPEMQGKRGRVTFTDKTRFLISPMPRFDNMVKEMKKISLDNSRAGEKSHEPDGG